MRRFATALAVAALMTGSVVTAQSATAAQTSACGASLRWRGNSYVEYSTAPAPSDAYLAPIRLVFTGIDR